jgi:hypothetical protein
MYEVVRQAYRRTLPQFTIILFGIASASPLIKAYMTCSDDGVFHIHKALGLETLIKLGHWFPRWTPHMAHGFGYPLYNFYAPLSSYLLAGIHNMGAIYPLALHIALGMCIAFSGLAIFYLVRDFWGPWSGLSAAVVYQTSPYLAFNVLFRGALAETMAISLMPIALWTMHRTLRRTSIRWAALASLSFGALIYTHSASALLMAPLLLLQVFLLSYRNRDAKAFTLGVCAFVLAVLLSANFWLPALTESHLVKIEQLLVPPVFSYETNFLSVKELLAFPQSTIPGLVNPSPQKALGIFAASIALLGAGVALSNRLVSSTSGYFYRPRVTILFVVGMVIYGSLTLPISQPVWDLLPLLGFIQFPWRALSVTTLCAAVLAGGTLLYFRRPVHAIFGSVIIASLSFFTHLSWWYPRYCTEFTEITLSSMIDYEYNTSTIGTSAKGEFTPKTTNYVSLDDSLSQAIKNNQQPERLIGIPDDATVQIIQSDPLDYLAKVSSPRPFTAIYQMIYYLGWNITIDGVSQRPTIADGTGIMQFHVPSGQHDIRVYFGTTPIRSLGAALSVVSLCVIFGAFVFIPPKKTAGTNSFPLPYIMPKIWVIPLLLLTIKTTIIDKTDNIFHRLSVEPSDLGIPLSIDMNNSMKALAYNINPKAVPSGGALEAVIYVGATENIGGSFRPYFLLKDPDGLVWNILPHETVPPRWHREPPPTQYWKTGDYGQFARQYQVMPGTPPGQYNLVAIFFDESTLETVKTVGSTGTITADEIDLGTVSVVRPSMTVMRDSLGTNYSALGGLTDDIELLRGNFDRQQVSPGEILTITMLFRATDNPASDELIQIGLDGTSFTKIVDPTPGFRTSLWQQGDIWSGQYLVRIPADTSDGEHQWTVTGSSGDELSFGLIDIKVPDRVYNRPLINNATHLSFGKDIMLLGHETSIRVSQEDVLEIMLLWQPIHTPNNSLNSFVHIENNRGVVVAQHDGIPANWSRPTPGWLPGEYIIDIHPVPIIDYISSETYQVYVGLYDRTTGERVSPNNNTLDETRAYIGSVVIEQ